MKKNFSCALFTVVLSMIAPVVGFAQSGSVNLSSEGAVVGEPWIVTVLVDHGVPDEVFITAPVFPATLYLDRYYKSPRLMGTQFVTSVEYTFLPARAGTVRIDSFVINTPEGSVETSPFVLIVQDPNAGARSLFPRVIWTAPSEAVRGESITLELRVTGLTGMMPSLQQLPPELFFPEVPPSSILAALSLTDGEREGGTAVKFNLILLEGDFVLSAQIVRHENIVFEIPALRIRVSNRPVSVSENFSHEDHREIETHRENLELGLVPFPDFDFAEFDKTTMGRIWRRQFEEIYNTAQELWEHGFRAQALAELRLNEREHPAGTWLRPVRQQAEESLGIFGTENENRQRRYILLGLSFLIILVVLISPFVYFLLTRKPLWKKAVLLLCVFFLAVAGFVCLYLFTDSRRVFFGRNNRFGITNTTPVRRTADSYGQELFIFKEGQPIIILLNSGTPSDSFQGTWVYVRTNDDKNSSGWIPADTVIFY